MHKHSSVRIPLCSASCVYTWLNYIACTSCRHESAVWRSRSHAANAIHNQLSAISPCLIAVQGAATSVYAATAPELAGKSGAYLVNCDIAEPSAQAQDAELARKLWAVTEKQLQDPSART